MSTKTPLPTVNEKVTESVSINVIYLGSTTCSIVNSHWLISGISARSTQIPAGTLYLLCNILGVRWWFQAEVKHCCQLVNNCILYDVNTPCKSSLCCMHAWQSRCVCGLYYFLSRNVGCSPIHYHIIIPWLWVVQCNSTFYSISLLFFQSVSREFKMSFQIWACVCPSPSWP